MPGQNPEKPEQIEEGPHPVADLKADVDMEDVEERLRDLLEAERSDADRSLNEALAADDKETPDGDLMSPKRQELIKIRMYLRAIALYLRDLSQLTEGLPVEDPVVGDSED